MSRLSTLSSKPTSGGLYIHDSEHPYVCTDIMLMLSYQRVEAEYLYSGRRRDRRADRHEHDKSRWGGGSCISSTIFNLPDIPERSRISVHDAIHNRYKAEIVRRTLSHCAPEPSSSSNALPLACPMSPIPASGGISVAAIGLQNRPIRAPYLGHWAPGATFPAIQWFHITWNYHVALACGTILQFNVVLGVLTIV